MPSAYASASPAKYEQITALGSVASLAPAASATWALIQAETFDVRWRDDGSNPTAAVGMKLAAGTTLDYKGDLTAIRFIKAVAGAKLNVSYYK